MIAQMGETLAEWSANKERLSYSKLCELVRQMENFMPWRRWECTKGRLEKRKPQKLDSQHLVFCHTVDTSLRDLTLEDLD